MAGALQYIVKLLGNGRVVFQPPVVEGEQDQGDQDDQDNQETQQDGQDGQDSPAVSQDQGNDEAADAGVTAG